MSLRSASRGARACGHGPRGSSRRSVYLVARDALQSLDSIVDGSMRSRAFSTSARRQARHADHYGSLKLHRTATKQQIKARFYELSKKTHPDTPGGSSEKFHEINEAYSILGDESKRREYDRSTQPASASRTTSSSPSSGHHAHHPGHYTYDYHNRKSGPHAGWSTRRPPPRGPPPFTGGTYSPFGRHTPSGYAGASSGTYGDPWAQAREQWRAEFSHVRMGRTFTGQGGSGTSGGGAGGTGGQGGGRSHRGPKAPLSKDDPNSGHLFQILAVCSLVMLGLACGGGITAKADEGGGHGDRDYEYELD